MTYFFVSNHSPYRWWIFIPQRYCTQNPPPKFYKYSNTIGPPHYLTQSHNYTKYRMHLIIQYIKRLITIAQTHPFSPFSTHFGHHKSSVHLCLFSYNFLSTAYIKCMNCMWTLQLRASTNNYTPGLLQYSSMKWTFDNHTVFAPGHYYNPKQSHPGSIPVWFQYICNLEKAPQSTQMLSHPTPWSAAWYSR